MRQPILFAIIPILYIALSDLISAKNKLNCIYSYAFKFSPLLLFLPFLIKNLVFGLSDNQFDFVSTDSSQISLFINRIKYAIVSGKVFQNALSLFPLWCLLIIPIAFLNPFKSLIKLNFSLIFLFLALIILFYSIAPGLWGLTKYQVEITAPFVVLGIINMIWYLKSRKNYYYLLIIFLFGLSVLNINYYNSNKEYSTYQSSIIPLNFGDAYSYINNQGLSASTYSIGTTYGIMPEIMNGYSQSEVFSAKRIYDSQRVESGERLYSYKNIDSIIKNPKILSVILGFTGHKKEFIEIFQLNGWRLTQEFDNGYGDISKVFILER
ncbi:hypothetical protein N9M18_02280 [Candidatus Pseudothioglobus singularis]|nr:hypothetical protein [Candidatus Pseudothioglobus singularis]